MGARESPRIGTAFAQPPTEFGANHNVSNFHDSPRPRPGTHSLTPTGMARLMKAAIGALLMAGLAAAADDGDDFSNNLFSDLAP
jgi:hypothetical protein